MGKRLSDGSATHEALDLRPLAGPAQPQSCVPARNARILAKHVFRLPETVRVMCHQLVDPSLEAAKPPLMRREHLVDIERAHRCQRIEKLGEWVARLLRMHRDVRAYPRQYVVTADQQPPRAVVETDMPRRVSGCVHRHEVPSTDIHPGAILE